MVDPIAVITHVKELGRFLMIRRRLAFDDHIEPIYRDMQVVHEDYLSAFVPLLDLPCVGEAEVDAIAKAVHILHTSQQNLKHLRIKTFAYSREGSIYFGKKQPARLFCKACLSYFGAQSGKYPFIMYEGHFSRTLEELPKILQYMRNNNVCSLDPNGERNIVSSLAEDHIKKLMHSWERLTIEYVRCRLEYLK